LRSTPGSTRHRNNIRRSRSLFFLDGILRDGLSIIRPHAFQNARAQTGRRLGWLDRVGEYTTGFAPLYKLSATLFASRKMLFHYTRLVYIERAQGMSRQHLLLFFVVNQNLYIMERIIIDSLSLKLLSQNFNSNSSSLRAKAL
jgi:hypothetical protein